MTCLRICMYRPHSVQCRHAGNCAPHDLQHLWQTLCTGQNTCIHLSRVQKVLSLKKYCLTMQHDSTIQCTAGVIQPIFAVTFVRLTLAVLSAELAEPEVLSALL